MDLLTLSESLSKFLPLKNTVEANDIIIISTLQGIMWAKVDKISSVGEHKNVNISLLSIPIKKITLRLSDKQISGAECINIDEIGEVCIHTLDISDTTNVMGIGIEEFSVPNLQEKLKNSDILYLQ